MRNRLRKLRRNPLRHRLQLHKRRHLHRRRRKIPLQGPVVDRNVQAMPGSDVRVGIYTSIKQDCTSGPLPAIRLVTPPAHGTITVKRATLKATNFKQCLATDVPAFVAFYRAAAKFQRRG